MAAAVAEPSSNVGKAKSRNRSAISKPAKMTRAELREARAKVTFDVPSIPLATFMCLLATSDKAEARRAKAAFTKYVLSHPHFADWREAWNAFAQRPTPQVKAAPMPERGKIVAIRPAQRSQFTTATAAADFIRNLK
jgi:hypothetical protein